MFDSKAIGKRLKSGLADAGMSSDELAKIIGSSRGAVSKWMNGHDVMGLEIAVRICDVFDWPLDRLAVRGEYDDQPKRKKEHMS